MRSKESDRTPKQEAYDIALGWIYGAAKKRTGDVENTDDRESFQKLVQYQLAELWERLAEEIDMDVYPTLDPEDFK
jgi:hypothetical protein